MNYNNLAIINFYLSVLKIARQRFDESLRENSE